MSKHCFIATYLHWAMLKIQRLAYVTPLEAQTGRKLRRQGRKQATNPPLSLLPRWPLRSPLWRLLPRWRSLLPRLLPGSSCWSLLPRLLLGSLWRSLLPRLLLGSLWRSLLPRLLLGTSWLSCCSESSRPEEAPAHIPWRSKVSRSSGFLEPENTGVFSTLWWRHNANSFSPKYT